MQLYNKIDGNRKNKKKADSCRSIPISMIARRDRNRERIMFTHGPEKKAVDMPTCFSLKIP
jgi:hypothetical protein